MKTIGKIILLVFLAGCTPVKVVDYRPGVESKTLTAFKTFSFYAVHVSGNRGPYFIPNLEICKRAIASQMTARGFSEVADGGDLAINIGVVLKSKSQPGATEEIQYMNVPNYAWPETPQPQTKVTEGTITIEMVDPIKKSGVWIGAVTGLAPADETLKQQRIKGAMDILFEKFPVKAR